MKIRGQRECAECGTRWSYYDTGSVSCPDCGSLRSVGVDAERTLHTDRPADFDLTPARELLDSRPLREVADRAGELAREYVRRRGFVRAGDLLPLDDTYLAAQELRHAADVVGRGLALDDAEEWYFLALLRAGDAGGSSAPASSASADDAGAHEGRTEGTADEGRTEGTADEGAPDDRTGGRRPTASEVPGSMAVVRGLAAADAAGEYRREMADWLDDRDDDSPASPGPDARDALETLGDHVRRVWALDGEVDPETADLLVEAAREIGESLRSDDPDALANARETLGRLA